MDKKWKISTYVCSCCSMTMLIVAIVIPFALLDIIKSQASNEAIMTSDNYALWGQIPGDTNTYLKRDFTFYEFTNPYDVMFRGHKPIFYEQGPYSYQEVQNFTNPTYNEDGSIVTFRAWIQTLGEKQNDSITFANFVALGAWYQLQNTESPIMALQVFSAFYFELKKFFYPTMIASAVIPQFLNEQQAKNTFLSQYSEEKQNFIWFDSEFGMANTTAFVNWIQVVKKQTDDSFLRNYFQLTQSQINDIIKQLQPLITGAEGALKNLFCKDSPTGECYDKFLCAKQWSSQAITMDPDSGSIPVPSVITGNSTSHGFPELSYFYSDYFLKFIEPHNDNYKNLSFTTQWALSILDHYENYSINDPQYLTSPNILMHIGNLRYLYQQGKSYDSEKSNTYLYNIANRFGLPSKEHARVFYEYVKYMEEEFGVQKSINGTKGIAGLGTIASQALYEEVMNLQNNLLNIIVSELVIKEITECSSILNNIDDITDDIIQQFCSLNQFNQWNRQSIQQLLYVCEFQESTFWKQLQQTTGIKNTQLMQLCDQDEQGFGQIVSKAQQKIKIKYQCNLDQCTKHEIAIKQWYSSLISLNPIDEIYEPKDSIGEIYSEFNKIEYIWFQNQFYDVFTDKQLDYDLARYLLSFECLYNGQMISNAFIHYSNNNLQEFQQILPFDDFTILHYIRYIIVQLGFEGLADTRTVDELLFGYWPGITTAIKEMNPAMGGDPSTPITGLNLNIPDLESQVQSVYTGKGDISKVRKYAKVDGYSYLTAKLPYFDGNQSTYQQFNPWNVKVQCDEGTDAFSYEPGLSPTGSIGTIITDIVKNIYLDYNETIDFYGLEAYIFRNRKTTFNIDKDFNNYIWNGLENMTNIQNAPLFNSPTHFYNGDIKLQEMIEIYKHKNLTDRQYASDWDDSYVIYEPYSGVALAALLNLMISVEYKQDILFPSEIEAFLPVMQLWRGANWTNEQIDITFGELKDGLKLRWILAFVFYGLCVLFLVISILTFLKYRKIRKAMVEDTYQEFNSVEGQINQ